MGGIVGECRAAQRPTNLGIQAKFERDRNAILDVRTKKIDVPVAASRAVDLIEDARRSKRLVAEGITE